MERLWTPWRMTYISGLAGESSGCFLCDHPAADRASDEQNLLVHRGSSAFVILNLYPYNTGHIVIAPYEHTGSYQSLSPDTRLEMDALVATSLDALQAEYQPQGFNVGMNLGRVAGAGVPDHLHMHVVPRWGGDANFMTTIGETKVLPEELPATYKRLAPHFRASS
jgi:ATP adenylyltransferase